MIYNWLDHAWRIESPVPIANVSYESCGLIKDPSTGRYNVLVAGGMITSVTGQTSPSTSSWLWDPMTGNIQIRFLQFQETGSDMSNSNSCLVHNDVFKYRKTKILSKFYFSAALL
jgi:hypothetical protein